MLCTVSQIQNIDIHLVMLMVYYLVMKIISFLLTSGLGIHSLLFFALWLLSLFLKERPERIALVALYLKSDSCNSFLSLFAKRATGANIIFKSDGSNSLFTKEWFTLFKSDSLQMHSFHHAFPFLCPIQKIESLFIALLALLAVWKRGNCTRCSF